MVVAIANITQSIDRSNSQISFILAGTPELLNHLSTIGPKDPETGKTRSATFVERNDKLYPGRLDYGAAREALLMLFESNGWKADDKVLNKVLDEAQGYPWFIQLWGEALWDQGRHLREINNEIMEAARSRVEKEKITIYNLRYDELNKPLSSSVDAGQVLYAAVKVADFCLKQNNMPILASEFTEILNTLDDAGISVNDHKALKRRLLHTGLIVEKPIGKKMYIDVGIPSLASYIVESRPLPATISDDSLNDVQETTTELPKP